MTPQEPCRLPFDRQAHPEPELNCRAARVVSRYQSMWTTPPSRIPANHSADGPLLGNGDMKVALGGTPEELLFFLSKNDLWRLQHGDGNSCPVPFGHLSVRIPALADASYNVTQDFCTGTTMGAFRTETCGLRMKSYVAATENMLVVELTAESEPLEVQIAMEVASGRGSHTEQGRESGIDWGTRAFSEGVDIPSGAAAAWTVLDAGNTSFILQPDAPTALVLAMESLFKKKDYLAQAVAAVSGPPDVEELYRKHTAWWATFWSKSWVEIGDPEIEQAYYRSLYGMAACSRDPRFPPGIFGWETTDTPSWQGDYHLNYNHMAPFYALYSGNRIEQADPEDAPILDFRERGRWYARHVTGTRGVLYPVGIGPLGIETTYDAAKFRDTPHLEHGGLFLQQRSNTAYCLVNMAQRWRTTYDTEYGRKVYPFVLEVISFWEDFLRFEGGRYVIYGDAVHEGSGRDMNSILSLGLLRNSLDLALDMSDALKVDADRREKWLHILEHLSEWSTHEDNGDTVFRYTEEGPASWHDNTVGVQHIYPGNALGIDSSPEWKAVAHNTIRKMQRWLDANGSNSFFPAAVRIGFDPGTILDQLHAYVRNTYPNGFLLDNPHGIENLSTVPNTINEMLCMSHVPVGKADRAESVIRLFPVWPNDRSAAFHNIRTWGAFLVSSELRDGEVQYAKITSEQGRDCTIVNPWPGATAIITGSDGTKRLSGNRLVFRTPPNSTVTLRRDPCCR